MSAVNALEQWFKTLNRRDQEDIVSFLYDGHILIREGLYFGPAPRPVIKGLYCGPAPQSRTNFSPYSAVQKTCPTCGKIL